MNLESPTPRAIFVALDALRKIAERSKTDPASVIARVAIKDFVAIADEQDDGTGPNWQPDMSDAGQALARRVQAALEREFDGEPLFRCAVVVQENTTRRVGIAATGMNMDELDAFLLMGRGAAKRADRRARELEA